jgi:tRNA modification GTPase
VYEHDTIAAIATPPGHGGVAIIRISGPHAETIARQVFRLSRPRETLQSHHFYLGHLVDSITGHLFDQALLVTMRAPQSYTGENVVELHCHGGNFLSHRVLEIVLRHGARLAAPGEFTKRAFLNNRLDLSQAEAVQDLIQATTTQGLNLAWEQLSGRLSDACTVLRERLVGLTAYVEAFIDFPEEDLPERTQQELSAEMSALATDIAALASTFTQGKVYREGCRTAIVGKPNVGKSSLLNLLSGTERAIVTPVPGTTRDILEETVVLQGIPLVIWDTAGLRETSDTVERIGVERAKAGLAAAELVLAVFDASKPLEVEDEFVFSAIQQKRMIPILNKVDLPVAVSSLDLQVRLNTPSPVLLSTKTGVGFDELGRRVRQVLFAGEPTLKEKATSPGAIVTRVRHRDALLKAERGLLQARQNLRAGVPLDLVAVDLRTALDHIGEITGHVSNEDILDRIFRDFCIGK